MSQSNSLAFTAPINPPGATPFLSRQQVWEGLLLKIRSAETFVPAAISSTTVRKESVDADGHSVTTRLVTFRENQREVEEIVTAFEPSRVEFNQTDGGKVVNAISEGADGELYMTYLFEIKHGEVSAEEKAALLEKQKAGSKMAVEGTIKAMRQLLTEGKL